MAAERSVGFDLSGGDDAWHPVRSDQIEVNLRSDLPRHEPWPPVRWSPKRRPDRPDVVSGGFHHLSAEQRRPIQSQTSHGHIQQKTTAAKINATSQTGNLASRKESPSRVNSDSVPVRTRPEVRRATRSREAALSRRARNSSGYGMSIAPSKRSTDASPGPTPCHGHKPRPLFTQREFASPTPRTDLPKFERDPFALRAPPPPLQTDATTQRDFHPPPRSPPKPAPPFDRSASRSLGIAQDAWPNVPVVPRIGRTPAN